MRAVFTVHSTSSCPLRFFMRASFTLAVQHIIHPFRSQGGLAPTQEIGKGALVVILGLHRRCKTIQADSIPRATTSFSCLMHFQCFEKDLNFFSPRLRHHF